MPYTILYICHIHIHTHMWHICINIYDIHPTTCYMLPVCVYIQAQKPSFIPRSTYVWEGNWVSELGIHVHVQHIYKYKGDICTHQKSDVPFHICTCICYLHTLTSVTYINIHMWKIHICMRMSYIYGMYYCTWHMYMYICTYVTYMHIYMCYLHTHYICYLHIYPTYIHIWVIRI